MNLKHQEQAQAKRISKEMPRAAGGENRGLAVIFPELLDYRELARITKKSVVTLRRYKMQGLGPRFIRIGRHVRFREEDVVAWLDSCAEEGRGRSRS
jgi:predicted DNA-binding transcriptional regulator AlpA